MWVEYPAALRCWGSRLRELLRPSGWNLSMAPLCRPTLQGYSPVRRAALLGEHLGDT